MQLWAKQVLTIQELHQLKESYILLSKKNGTYSSNNLSDYGLMKYRISIVFIYLYSGISQNSHMKKNTNDPRQI